MHIVDVCGFYSPHGGGVRTYVDQKLAMAERFGHEVTIIAPGDERTERVVGPGARIITVAAPRFILDRKYHSFKEEEPVHEELDRLDPDLVEASSPWNSATFVTNWRKDVPKALIMHSEPLSAHVYRWFEYVATPEMVDVGFNWFWERLRHYGRNLDAVVCANSHLAGRLAEGGVQHTVTVPMGVQPGVFSPRRRDEALREHLLAQCDLGPDATLLVNAGRLATEKRIPMLVGAVTQAGRHRQIGLVIFGEGRAQTKIVRAIGGNPHIRLFRAERDRDRFASILASADALLHGCEAETFGMTTAEAQASGIPVIAPDKGGAADFARREPSLTYRANDPADAARAILSLPERFVTPVAAPGQRNMEDHFRDLFALYEGLRNESRSQAA